MHPLLSGGTKDASASWKGIQIRGRFARFPAGVASFVKGGVGGLGGGLTRLVFIHWETEGVTEGPSICGQYQLPSSLHSVRDWWLPLDQCGKLRI